MISSSFVLVAFALLGSTSARPGDTNPAQNVAPTDKLLRSVVPRQLAPPSQIAPMTITDDKNWCVYAQENIGSSGSPHCKIVKVYCTDNAKEPGSLPASSIGLNSGKVTRGGSNDQPFIQLSATVQGSSQLCGDKYSSGGDKSSPGGTPASSSPADGACKNFPYYLEYTAKDSLCARCCQDPKDCSGDTYPDCASMTP